MADRLMTPARVAVAVLAGLSLSACVAAQNPDGPRSSTSSASAAAGVRPAAAGVAVTAPAWRVGDRWLYSDGYGLTVETTAKGLTKFQRLDDPKQWHSRRGFLRQDAQSATKRRSVIFRSIAASDATRLDQGRPIVFTREFTSNDRTHAHSTSWLFEGADRISVPAGDFEAYVIVMRTRNPETGWTGFERWWYAPSVRNYVRLEYRYGDMPIGSRVLTDYDLASPRQAVEAPSSPAIVEPEPAALAVIPEIRTVRDVQKFPIASRPRATPANSSQILKAVADSASHGPNGDSFASTLDWSDSFDAFFAKP